ncbi:alpha/beta hydrolase [Pseudoprimorskyibacter insulae]|uniref:Carboxylesterase NlhH n=1 Tax=Pseudoprimorskyibacter insulae TaxID=1695997 RepID=A0A2R8AQF8_9RHOB|nr:alpha/beta hydrolase [Pseudoprimorskyibacter insulae]SPF78338.1 Carboxylesterase NlhH [Pseudoprimorskyibacter insulae]
MINPEINTFMERWTAEWASLKQGATPADRRAHFEVVAKNMALPVPEDVDCDTVHWVEGAASPVRVRVYRHTSGGVQPVLIYMHGGAWMQGSPETHGDITARIASWNRQTVISVDYALAPEHPFPEGFTQVCDVVRWCRANAADLGIDADRIAIGGDSAGGNLAAAAALELRGEVPLIGQLLIYPACDFEPDRPSMIENAEAPLLQTRGMDGVNRMYTGGQTDLLSTDPRVAPLVAKDHSGLPPAFVAVAQNDPLRDSGIAYAEALSAAGVAVEVDHGEGLIHGYMRAMEFCADSRTKLQAMSAWLAARNAA